MESLNWLGSQEILYLKSQLKDKKKKHVPEYKSRIKEKIEKCFNTLDVVLESQEIDLEYLNMLFPAQRIKNIMARFCRNDKTDSSLVEKNRLEITHDMLHLALKFYQDRFKETKFLKKKMDELDTLIYELNKLSNEERERSEISKIYRTRKRWALPPKILPSENWQSECMICWSYASGLTKLESMKNIRHEPGCTYDKNDLDRCFKFLPPQNMK